MVVLSGCEEKAELRLDVQAWSDLADPTDRYGAVTQVLEQLDSTAQADLALSPCRLGRGNTIESGDERNGQQRDTDGNHLSVS
ncbi:MAG: hypothetical protein ACREK5_12050 [Gemmatimonadota bacterium]